MVTLRNSIATYLFKVIFGLYLVVTIIVTITQMVFEYEHVTRTVRNEISQLPVTYIPGLGTALWTFNDRAIRSMLIGINEIAVVTGVKIDDGTDIRAIGKIASEDHNYIEYDHLGNQKSTSNDKPFSRLIDHEFDITYLNGNGETVKLGTGTIYTSSAVIFERVKYGFVLIVINSVIKTLALWFIFLFFMRRILSRPLVQLANETERISFDNLKDAKLSIETNGRNELKVLEESFNKMIGKLLQSRNKLDAVNQHLEEKVKERTYQLENEVQVRKLAQQEAEKSNSIKSDFIANISHEVRTPMTSIYGMACFMQKSKLDDEQKQYADVIVRNCENLMSLIEEILDFSKMESGRIELEITSVDLKEFLESLVNLFHLQAAKKNIEISFSIHPGVPPSIEADEQRLRQILANLVNNAMKFTESGGITIDIALSDTDHEKLQFSVSDTGIGIPENSQAKIFDSFTQVDSSTTRKYGGTGLGLAICKRFIDLMGGEIWVVSEPGEGSTFSFTINACHPELESV